MSDKPKATISIGKERAIALADTKWWVQSDSRTISVFQMYVDELCCPFEVFHKAIEETLGRPVWTHELGLNAHGIRRELRGESGHPTMEEIMGLIPEEKRIVVVMD